MAGGLIDDLRGAATARVSLTWSRALRPLARCSHAGRDRVLETGGAFAVSALDRESDLELRGALQARGTNLAAGVELAVAVAVPVVVASMVFEVASALVARAASPAFVQPLLAPLRSLAFLASPRWSSSA